MILTYKYRVKDATSRKRLAAHARACNYVWNYLCDVQRHAQKWHRRWPTHFDLTYLTAGCSRELGLHSDTIGELCRYFVVARNAKRGCPRFRSHRRSLGWVPFRDLGSAKLDADTIRYRGNPISIRIESG
jgi:putative transposase